MSEKEIHILKLSYVLMTAARNEEAYIEKTMQSVITQTVLPKKWIIVSDGSTDRTDEIVKKYANEHSWITLLRMPENTQRDFASKAHCVNAAYEVVKSLQFDIVVNLDADVSFEKNFFELLLEKFQMIPELGVAGALYLETGHVPVYSFRDVAGQCQIFRRNCFEQIGGYVPSKYGGIDNIAVLMARMKGWKTQTFGEITFFHHRFMSTAETNKWKAMMKHGREDYLLGNHPLWEMFRVVYQITKKPYAIRSIMLMYGFLKAFMLRMERPVSQEFIRFYRNEQVKRMKTILSNLFRGKINLEET